MTTDAASRTAPAVVPLDDSDPVPLVVDLDGTLLSTDSLLESMVVLAHRNPQALLKWPAWLAQGRAAFKQHLAELAMPEVQTLPYREDLLQFLREEKRRGRTLVLATGAHELLAHAVARQLELFDVVLATHGNSNLSGDAKRDRLVAAYGERGFDYIGNDRRDLPVWRAARKAFVVSRSNHLVRRVAVATPVEKIFAPRGTHGSDILHAVRVHHWIKNALVFVPLFAAHRMLELDLLTRAGLAALAFCFCASSIYLLNDFLDLPADRHHPQKKARRLAAGQLRLIHALTLMALLAMAAVATSLPLPRGVLGALGGYYVVMIAYSIALKDVPVLDVLLLASGYALRVVTGSLATGIPLSASLLAFCVFFFLSLALVKRYAELALMEKTLGRDAAKARGYLRSDRQLLLAQGVTSGYLAVLVLALYTNTGIVHTLYSRPQLFWLLCFLLLHWISYVWLMAVRGRMHHDPVVFAVTDRMSRWLVLAMGLVVLLAL